MRRSWFRTCDTESCPELLRFLKKRIPSRQGFQSSVEYVTYITEYYSIKWALRLREIESKIPDHTVRMCRAYTRQHTQYAYSQIEQKFRVLYTLENVTNRATNNLSVAGVYPVLHFVYHLTRFREIRSTIRELSEKDFAQRNRISC